MDSMAKEIVVKVRKALDADPEHTLGTLTNKGFAGFRRF